MGKTYKDRESAGHQRSPDWDRLKPSKKKKKRNKDDNFIDPREEYFDEIYSQED